MAKSPLDLLNKLGMAAHAKVQKSASKGDTDMDMDDEPVKPMNPKAKQVAAMKSQEKAKGKMPFKK